VKLDFSRVRGLGGLGYTLCDDSVIYASRSTRFQVGDLVLMGTHVYEVTRRQLIVDRSRRYAFHIKRVRELTTKELKTHWLRIVKTWSGR
jgi:hypothetical protein